MFGITRDEFLYIKENEALIKENLGKDPAELALRGLPSVLSRQIKSLESCREKLPRYYRSLCVIPPLSLQQATDHRISETRELSGKRALDLTCGLGGDSSALSLNFDEVISIERDPLLAEIARYNLEKMGSRNITVINESAEGFLENYDGEPFDVIFCDPSRRDGERRTFLLDNCSPDVTQLLPLVKRHSSRFVIKLSPLFDCDELLRIYQDNGITVGSASLDGECKEVMADIRFDNSDRTKCATIVHNDGTFQRLAFPAEKSGHTPTPPESRNFIYIADVTIKKLSAPYALMKLYYIGKKASVEGSVIITEESLTDFPGRSYHIIRSFNSRRELRNFLKTNKIKTGTIIKEMAADMTELKREIGLSDGVGPTLLLTFSTAYLVDII